MLERIYALHCLRQIPAHMTHDLKKLVFIEPLLWQPERYVFVTCGVLAVRFELRDLALFELPDEARVFRPEQPDVLNVKKLHGPAFQSEAECPTHFSLDVLARVGHHSVMDHSRAQDLQPSVVVVNF